MGRLTETGKENGDCPRFRHRRFPKTRAVPVFRASDPAAGWTLVELVIVISIIVILAGLAMVQYRNSVTLAQEAALKEDLFRMRDAIDQYYADKNKDPANLQELVSEGYLRSIPDDPFTRSNTTWQEIQGEPDPDDFAAEPGVVDVKSGSEKVGSDGRPYTEW